jgi:hypothetical protein
MAKPARPSRIGPTGDRIVATIRSLASAPEAATAAIAFAKNVRPSLWW